jgi:trans-2,3-dihydro-3-hydroxyanthranilate isomerase
MGVIPRGSTRAVLGLNVGPIRVDLEWDGDRLRFVWMTQGNPVFGPIVQTRAEVAAALALDGAALAPGLPVQEISCGVPYLMVPLKDKETVDRAVSDSAAFARLSRQLGKDTPAIFLFASSPGEPESIYSRMFAPGLGVVEDPATGSAAGPLGCYLVQHRVVSGPAQQRIVNTQGVLMGRASRIHVAITGGPDSISQVRVGGQAVLAGRGELFA